MVFPYIYFTCNAVIIHTPKSFDAANYCEKTDMLLKENIVLRTDSVYIVIMLTFNNLKLFIVKMSR